MEHAHEIKQLVGLSFQSLEETSNVLEVLTEELNTRDEVFALKRAHDGIAVSVATQGCWLELWHEEPWPFQFADGGPTPIAQKLEQLAENSLYATANVARMDTLGSLIPILVQ